MGQSNKGRQGDGKKASGFGSFGDLKKALKGDDPEASGDVSGDSSSAEAQGGAEQAKIAARGWTLETDDGEEYELDEADLEGLPDPDSAIPARISRRPGAFGPMEHGPKCYADVHSEEMDLVKSFRLRTVFPDDVRSEVEGLPEDPRPKDFEGRRDLRGETIFTIDGADAKDYDDAIAIRPRDGGGYHISVHIADVSHYVRPGTALDDEALSRGTSVYLPDQVIPMLPEKLSNGLCSLVPHRDRLAFSVFMEFDESGERVSSSVAKSVIKSVHRNDYRIVQELLDGVDSEETREIEFLREPLEQFSAWTRVQQRIRDAKGSLRINSSEKKFLFDEKHEVKAIVNAPKYFSQTLIEETALAANQAVGDWFRAKGLPTIYRVHPEKDQEEIERVAAMLAKHGIRVPIKDRLTGRDIGRMIRLARRKRNAEALVQRIMGLVERAVYEVKDHEDVATHFGLARKAYLHFTSPIRRYPDLIVHRWLYDVMTREVEAAEELGTLALVEDLNDTAAHCSIQSEAAGMAEIAVKDLKVCQFMEPRIDQKFDAKVIRVSRGGMEVGLPELNVSGFLPARSIGDRPQIDGATLKISVGKRILSFTEGYTISVLVKDVDFLRLQVMFELAK
ncbi:Ribonuclease R [Planctomycetes bacterium Poly30]|uniref:Ribonuclease R n=1 Tax=Saltatorellus ferox TaxID=2528018 RepID=A0A518ETW3_9BACT|nr:Ribonuclease R [Planctomycetes bacterium Poly30]